MGDSNNEAQLTEQHVIIIACVCGFIIVTLLIILFCFIYRRRRNAAKTYQGGNQGDPPPYNAVPPNKKPQVYDNQGMDTSDLQLTPVQHRPTTPPPSPPPVHAISNSFTNNSYGPLDLNFTPGSSYHNSQPGSPHSRSRRPKEVNIERRPINGPPIEKKLFENEINHRRDNNRMDGYPITAHKDSPTSIPTKDKYIDLHDRGGGGDPMMGIEGYNEPSPGVGAGGKQKKSAKIKWRWQWKKKEAPPPAPQFAHNPPGHTCGLPCCNHEHDNIATNPTAPQQRGCVPVPLVAAPDFSNSNFFMKRKAGIETGLMRTPDNVIQTSGDGWEPRSYYNEKQGRTVLSIGKSHGVKSNAKKNSKKTEDLATSLRQRKKLAPWEHIRQRQITLPDTSSTYKMMFLNFQPGESSDFPEATPLHLNTPRREIAGALPSAEAIVNNKMYSLDGQEEADVNLSPSFGHREDIANLSTSDMDVRYGEASHRRLMNSELPPLPPDDDPSPQNDANNNTANNVASSNKDAASLGDTSSLLEDHVYDVPNDLLDQMEDLPKSSSWPQATSVSDVAMTTSSISDLYISDIDSVNYHGSGSDSNTESYVYNGSLLSQDVDGNESTAGYPVVFNNQPRPFDKSHYWPAAWRRLKNEKTVYLKNKPMHGFGETYLESDTGDTSSVDSSMRGDGGFTRGKHHFNPSAGNHLEDMGYLNLALTGASKNRSLPLKLWDLRLSSRNREQNLYSTFPLRRPILEDLTVGQFVRLPEYGYRHRHHSDVSTDHYVTRKIERILRAPVTRSSKGCDSPPASSVWVEPYKNMTDSDDKGEEDAAPSWRKLFRYKRQAVWENHFDSSNSKYELFPDWPKFENEDSEDEPITLSGIYNWGRECRARTVDATEDSPGEHAQEDGEKIEPDHLPSSSTNMYSSSNGGEFGDGHTRRGGIMYSRHPHAGANQTAPNDDVETAHVTRKMVWGDAGIVDWRRQAEQFKDKHFITLIL
ncbi:unnamed protein product [Lymnaea stagnalis]|uniref:Uncharacterized protein n=1 Tax=Lymnaea stagnalis TaxID=6523 RepID=A0AAV2HJ43_LYMST